MHENTLTKEYIIHFLKSNKKFLQKEFEIDEIILFGSYARDEATEKSDVDILIEAKNKNFDKKFDLKEFLEKEFNKKVDLAYIDSVRPFIMHFIKEELIYA